MRAEPAPAHPQPTENCGTGAAPGSARGEAPPGGTLKPLSPSNTVQDLTQKLLLDCCINCSARSDAPAAPHDPTGGRVIALPWIQPDLRQPRSLRGPNASAGLCRQPSFTFLSSPFLSVC